MQCSGCKKQLIVGINSITNFRYNLLRKMTTTSLCSKCISEERSVKIIKEISTCCICKKRSKTEDHWISSYDNRSDTMSFVIVCSKNCSQIFQTR